MKKYLFAAIIAVGALLSAYNANAQISDIVNQGKELMKSQGYTVVTENFGTLSGDYSFEKNLGPGTYHFVVWAEEDASDIDISIKGYNLEEQRNSEGSAESGDGFIVQQVDFVVTRHCDVEISYDITPAPENNIFKYVLFRKQ